MHTRDFWPQRRTCKTINKWCKCERLFIDDSVHMIAQCSIFTVNAKWRGLLRQQEWVLGSSGSLYKLFFWGRCLGGKTKARWVTTGNQPRPGGGSSCICNFPTVYIGMLRPPTRSSSRGWWRWALRHFEIQDTLYDVMTFGQLAFIVITPSAGFLQFGDSVGWSDSFDICHDALV